MDHFISYWEAKEPEFVKYFSEHYLCRPGKHYNYVYVSFGVISTVYVFLINAEKWARCYRHFDHADTDTNMYLERYITHQQMQIILYLLNIPLQPYSFHAKLKTIYLNGKVNRRIDFLIDALLKIERDFFYKAMTKERLKCLNQREIREVDRHQRGLKIDKEFVTVSEPTLKYLTT